jgi:hypothetical protein
MISYFNVTTWIKEIDFRRSYQNTDVRNLLEASALLSSHAKTVLKFMPVAQSSITTLRNNSFLDFDLQTFHLNHFEHSVPTID